MGDMEHAEEFAGRWVVPWEPGAPLEGPAGSAYRLAVEPDSGQGFPDLLADFLDQPGASAVTALVVGRPTGDEDFGDFWRAVEALVAARARLPGLTALFLGDITEDESEVFWIDPGDVSPLFGAYPALAHVRVRGGPGLALGRLRSEALKSLVVESCGLDAAVVRNTLRSELPGLEHLELWLGTDDRGATTTMEDLAPLFAGDLFPNLRSLGLKNSDLSDEIARAVAGSPLLGRLRTLDLSLGTLGDAGAGALLDAPAAHRLEKLDLHHHFCSEEMMAKLEALTIAVDAGEPQEPDDWYHEGYVAIDGEYRYVAVNR